MDGSQKLPQRLLAPIADRRAAGAEPVRLATGAGGLDPVRRRPGRRRRRAAARRPARVHVSGPRWRAPATSRRPGSGRCSASASSRRRRWPTTTVLVDARRRPARRARPRRCRGHAGAGCGSREPATPGSALIGATGHGLAHRRTIAELAAAGSVTWSRSATSRRCPTRRPGVPVFTDHRELLGATSRRTSSIVCTPPHTHLAIAATRCAPGRTCCWRSRRCSTRPSTTGCWHVVGGDRAGRARSGSRRWARPPWPSCCPLMDAGGSVRSGRSRRSGPGSATRAYFRRAAWVGPAEPGRPAGARRRAGQPVRARGHAGAGDRPAADRSGSRSSATGPATSRSTTPPRCGSPSTAGCGR